MPKANSRNLPAWYYRLVRTTIFEDREIGGDDFDEDLSEIAICSTCSKEESCCKCNGAEQDVLGEDAEDSDDDDEDSEDAVSERSYNGSDADYYYELKEQREDWKREVREQKEKVYAFDKSKEVEVQSAYDVMKLGKQGPVYLGLFDTNATNCFRIYSTDWVQHCFAPYSHASPYVDFYELDKISSRPSSEKQRPRRMNGHLYIDGGLGCDFKPFRPSQFASLNEIKLQSNDDKYEITIQFFSYDYLNLKISHSFFFQNTARPPKAPDFFEFVGIRRNREKERLEREREAKKRKRSPSPRDTFFERTHFMGSWAQSRW